MRAPDRRRQAVERAGCPGLWDINFLVKEGKHKMGKSELQAEGAGW